MKKLIASVIAIVICVGCVFLVNDKEEDYLRLHIRANSNTEYDQQIKYQVKDAVVEALVPLADGIDSKESMVSVLESNISVITAVVDSKLAELGQSYRSTVRVCEEKFPTRSYEELTLGAGVYDALIIELGSGKGDNWWCVAFPPLCFVTAEGEGDEVVYKSIFHEWFAKMNG